MKPDDGAPLPEARADVIRATTEPPGARAFPGRTVLGRARAIVGLAFAACLALVAASVLALVIVRVGGDWLDGVAPFGGERPRLHPRQVAMRELALDVIRQVILAVLVVGAVRWRHGAAWRRTLALAPPGPPPWGAPGLSPGRFALILLAWPLIHITWVTGSAELFRMPIGRHTSLSPSLTAGAAALWFTYVLVLAPLAEELLMRGALFARAREHFAPPGAILVTALLFAGAHLTPAGFARPVSLIPLALMLGWVRWRSGRLWPGIVLHAWSNFAMILYVLGPAIG
ncbi:CPBP family intramembrane glutamic endopeptidase [Methylobacterium sp. 37f]|uniref:CPBP family intramembrane glutamic endopeptidase n=1 Tax=Methylobacterium sp. 37f TaxID=2817058 RepID=UPI001FFD89D3|nr:CPBP family intramembrane glutamic endopeptidase [Methylobacterium sp. 37f]